MNLEMMKTLKKVIMLGAVAMLAACNGAAPDAMKSLTTNITDSFKRINAAPEETPLGKSGLMGIFNESNTEKQWPRVAITIESLSSNSFEDVPVFTNDHFEDSCVTVSAVIWDSSKSSHKIAPVEACVNKMARFKGVEARSLGVNSPFRSWAYGFCNSGHDCEEGNVARNGPRFPAYTLPTGSKYKEFVGNRDYLAMTLDALMQVMGEDVTSIDLQNDHRVWIAKMPTTAPEKSVNLLGKFIK